MVVVLFLSNYYGAHFNFFNEQIKNFLTVLRLCEIEVQKEPHVIFLCFLVFSKTIALCIF